MTQPVNVDSAVLRKEAANFERISEALKDQVARVQRTASELLAEHNWKGSARDAANGALNRYIEAAQAMYGGLNDNSTKLATAGLLYDSTDEQQSSRLSAAMGLGDEANAKHKSGVQLVDDREPKNPSTTHAHVEVPMAPGPLQAGQVPDPNNPFIDDPRFGHWEAAPAAPPYTGSTPPPLQPQYRPLPDGSPLKVGPTTGMYVPGKSWIGDVDPPVVQGQEEYRFKLAGEQATTMTRTVYENGHWQQERWVQNVYEYQRNTSMSFGGDVGVKRLDGGDGDVGGLPPIQNIDHTWKPISLPQIAALSGNNADTTYYLPDGCGGSVPFAGGVPQGSTGLPPRPPVMTAPR
jgi:WXG100 family type VII secretion target